MNDQTTQQLDNERRERALMIYELIVRLDSSDNGMLGSIWDLLDELDDETMLPRFIEFSKERPELANEILVTTFLLSAQVRGIEIVKLEIQKRAEAN